MFQQDVRQLVRERDWKLQDLATAMKISRSRLSNYLCGRRKPPLGIVRDIAKELGQDAETTQRWLDGLNGTFAIRDAFEKNVTEIGELLTTHTSLVSAISKLQECQEDPETFKEGVFAAVRIALRMRGSKVILPEDAWKAIIKSL